MPLFDDHVVPFDAGTQEHAVFRTAGPTFIRDSTWMAILQFELPSGSFNLDLAVDWNAWGGGGPNFRLWDYTNVVLLWEWGRQLPHSPFSVVSGPFHLHGPTTLKLQAQSLFGDNSVEIHSAVAQARIWTPGWPFQVSPGPPEPRTWHQRLLADDFNED